MNADYLETPSLWRKLFGSALSSPPNLGRAERAISGLAGAYLLRQAARAQGSPMRYPLALLGGLAVQRAISGRSELYASLKLSSADGAAGLLPSSLSEVPPAPVLAQVFVMKPRAEVYAKLSQLPELPFPKEELVAVHRTGPRLRVWIDDDLGALREYELEITEEKEGEELRFKARDSDRIPSGLLRLEEIPEGGTSLTVYLERKQSWLRQLGQAIGVDHDQKVVGKYLDYFKRLVEGESLGEEALREQRRETDYH